jgi:hypothetical protein
VTVGLFGVDAEHKGHSEVHPVYALAFRKDCAESHGKVTETWALFTRNTGNEGWCSRWNELHHLPLVDNGSFVLQLPLDSSAQSIAYGSSELYSNGKAARSGLISASGTTADVMISAAALTEGAPLRVHGLVTFSWTPETAGSPACVPAPEAPPHAASVDVEDDDAFLEPLLESAAYLRGQAGVASAASAEEKKKDEMKVTEGALELGTFSRTGPCPAQPAGPCPDELRARTIDAFLPKAMVAAAGVGTGDEADAYLCVAARAMHADSAQTAKGKMLDSREGIALRNLEALLSACDALASGNDNE